MPIGRKQVYLPNFKIGLLRTSHLPPNYAQFLVPLNLTKLDLRDYLLHVYGVKTLSVRSYVVQQKIQRIKNMNEMRREPYRPRAIKKMTVELEKPFRYPPEPEDLSPWDNAIWKAGKEEQKRRNKDAEHTTKAGGATKPDKGHRNELFDMARKQLGLGNEAEMEEVEVDR